MRLFEGLEIVLELGRVSVKQKAAIVQRLELLGASVTTMIVKNKVWFMGFRFEFV